MIEAVIEDEKENDTDSQHYLAIREDINFSY
jgi:hypothetical protein